MKKEFGWYNCCIMGYAFPVWSGWIIPKQIFYKNILALFATLPDQIMSVHASVPPGIGTLPGM
jgi:hypothetical protein